MIAAGLAWAQETTAPPEEARKTLTVQGSDSAQAVSFDSADQFGRVARLTMLINVPKGGTGILRLAYLPTGPDAASRPIKVKAHLDGPYPATRPAVAATPKPRRLHRKGNVLRLAFGLAADADPGSADGLLRLQTPHAVTLYVPVTAVGPKVALQPATVEMQVTESFLGIGGSGDEEEATVTGPGRRAVASSPPITATLPSSDSGSAQATLSFPAASAGGSESVADSTTPSSSTTTTPSSSTTTTTSGTTDEDGEKDGAAAAVDFAYLGQITVDGYSGNGTYNGQIVVDPASATPSALTVKVNVRDSILWPIVLVLLGGLLGWAIRILYGHHRHRGILLSAIKDAYNLYLTKRDLPDGPDLYDLEEDLGPEPRFPGWWDARTDKDRGRLGQLYADIRNATDDAEFTDVTARTKAMLAAFANWHELRTSAAHLAQAKAQAGDLDGLAKTDTEAIELSIQSPPPDDLMAEALARVRRQTRLLEAYGRLDKRLAELDQDHPGHRLELAAYEPKALYDQSRKKDDDPPGPDTELDAAAVWHMLNVLDAALDCLALPSPPADPPGIPPLRVTRELAEMIKGSYVRFHRDDGPPGGGTVAIELATAPSSLGQDRRSGRQIRFGLRFWDFWLSLATVAVVATAYVIGVYSPNASYGGFLALFSAFAAGLAGETVAKGFAAALGQLPFGKSYRPEESAPPAAG